ncbi:hypothetical protein NGM99_12030 [Mesorhizobium sp. RP14(2022)]|uniref:DUF4263 domain-containing protein n=1 Tax=Mesorhizobium liriopis TaxID=2953882 RepID=A0ABT1C6P9_9HYPH|nr:hypothetical protein [Mesorhizobium liriopis]MCO6050509.1 hypothetical protein [Mesorhizobium liriopis]
MKTASFATEADFQHLLASFPELLAGDQIDADVPRRFTLISREQPVAFEEGGGTRWSLDHLFLDQDGIPTLVEVKRGTDTRIRREVVGQMLDYAANSVLHWPVEELRTRFLSRCEQEGQDPRLVLEDLLGSDSESENFWDRVRDNLEAGRIRLLFVADRIPPELRRVVEFLNKQMQPAEVLAIELRQYEGQGLKTLVPIVLGQSEEASRRKTGSTGPRQRRGWDEEAIMAALAQRDDPTILPAAKRIADWIRSRADRVAFNDNLQWGSMGAVFAVAGTELTALRLHTDATVTVYFQYMMARPVFDSLAKRQELLARLNTVPGIRLPPEAVSKRKGIALADLTADSTSLFLEVMDWFVAELRTVTNTLSPVPPSNA